MLFGKYGQIVQKNLLKDKLTGMPRGVAFVRLVFPWFCVVYVYFLLSHLENYFPKIFEGYM